MAAQTVYPMGVGMFAPMGPVPLAGEAQGVTDMAAPQLVMLANVALTSEAAGCECPAEEKQMVELRTVGSGTYSDSEDESLSRFAGYDGTADAAMGLYPEPQPAQLAQPTAQLQAETQVVMTADSEEVRGGEQGATTPPERAPSPNSMAKRKRVQRSAEPVKKKKPFHCKPCQYQAECEEEFIHHIRRHSAKKLIVVGGADAGEGPAQEAPPTPEGGDGSVYAKGVIRCERCGYNTNRYDHYVAHLKHHTKEGDSQRVYKCTICTYTTVSQYHWKKHLRNHFPSKLYTCSQCCYFSDRKNNYVQHIRTHTGERPFRCPYCKYSSSQKTHLTRHMRTHSGERPFKCETCSYLAANQHEVTRHARQVHNGPKPLSCPHCQYKTADRSNYKKHVELHINPRQFLCPVCTYAASKKCNLQYHIKSRHRDCSDITMDVSKVKLRVKKPDSGSTYYKVDGDTQYVLTGIKEQKGQAEKKALKQGNGTAEEQQAASPINLSIKKGSKPAEAVSGEKERKDKTPKRGDQVPEKASSEKVEKVPVEERGTEKQTSQKAEKTERRERSGGKMSKARMERADQEGKQSEGGPERVEKKREKEVKKPGRTSKGADSAEVKTPSKRGRKAGKPAVSAEEKERVEKEKTERAEKERVEKESVEKEKVVRAEKERVEKERLEKERVEKEKAERERAEKAAEKARVEMERVEKEKAAEKARMEMERAEKEKTEIERVEKEKAEREKTEGKAEKEKMEEKTDIKNKKSVKSVRRSSQRPAKVLKGHVDSDQGRTPANQKGPGKTERKERVSVGKRKVAELEPSQPDHEASEQPAVSRKSKRKKDDEEPLQAGSLPRSSRKALATCQTAVGRPAKGRKEPATAQLQTRSKKAQAKKRQSSSPVESEVPEVREDRSMVEDVPKQVPNGDNPTEVSPEPRASSEMRSGYQEGSAEGQQCGNTDTQSSTLREAEQGWTDAACAGASGAPKAREKSTEPKQRGPGQPGSPLGLPGTVHKPPDTEEDEGIHSHEGSDISDNVSEGSDDSGLSGSGKLASPDMPTEEAPPVAAVAPSHTCIFCDRTFPMEVEYRRHLNRHLVNVYYLESATAEEER